MKIQRITFPFEKIPSSVFGHVWRPEIVVELKMVNSEIWIPVRGVLDTGADFTILPRYFAKLLGIGLKKDCEKIQSDGIGGSETVYLYWKARGRIKNIERIFPVGFMNRDNVPPLWGRKDFLETFRMVIGKRKLILEDLE